MSSAFILILQCVILAIRPVLLNILACNMETHSARSANTISPTLATLSEACIHAARHSLAICVDELTSGSVAIFGYAFPALIFSSALVLIVSSLLPIGNANDLSSADTAIEMLRILCISDNLASKYLYELLQRVRQCRDGDSFQTVQPALFEGHGNVNDPSNLSSALEGSILTSASSCQPPLDSRTSDPLAPPALAANEIDSLYLTTEMALQQPTMQDFLNRSSIDVGLLRTTEMHSNFDEFFLRFPDFIGIE